jgi:hypothetical protein
MVVVGKPDVAKPEVGFVIAGTQKGGTTALASYLYEHPHVGMPTVKEVHFFDTEEWFGGASVDYSNYHAYFKPKPTQRIAGDATPIYMYWMSAPRRIWEYNPAMKFIVLLRNPVTRAYSHWNMERALGRDELSFDEAIRSEATRCREALPLQHRRFSYIDRGLYSQQLQRIWQHFPTAQTLIMKSETLQHAPMDALNRICDFLGIARFAAAAARNVHARPYEAPMSDASRNYLREAFAGEIDELQRALGWDCSDWLKT